jgi:hypothetical protein
MHLIDWSCFLPYVSSGHKHTDYLIVLPCLKASGQSEMVWVGPLSGISNKSLQRAGSHFAKGNKKQTSMDFGRSETNSLCERIVIHLASAPQDHSRSPALCLSRRHWLILISDAGTQWNYILLSSRHIVMMMLPCGHRHLWLYCHGSSADDCAHDIAKASGIMMSTPRHHCMPASGWHHHTILWIIYKKWHIPCI